MSKAALTAIFIAAILSGCVQPDPQIEACNAAKTYGEKFGTPTSRGPCWGRTISHHATGNIEVFMVEMPSYGYAVGTMTYINGVMDSAGVTRG